MGVPPNHPFIDGFSVPTQKFGGTPISGKPLRVTGRVGICSIGPQKVRSAEKSQSPMIHVISAPNRLLVGGLEHFFYTCVIFPLGIIPTGFHIFQRGGSTTNQMVSTGFRFRI